MKADDSTMNRLIVKTFDDNMVTMTVIDTLAIESRARSRDEVYIYD